MTYIKLCRPTLYTIRRTTSLAFTSLLPPRDLTNVCTAQHDVLEMRRLAAHKQNIALQAVSGC